MPLTTAVIVVVPMLASAVARPCDPAALPTLAILVFDEFHVADVVTFRILPFEKVPRAVSCVIVAGAMLWLAGVMERVMSVDDETFSMLPDPPPHPCWKMTTSTAEAARVMDIQACKPLGITNLCVIYLLFLF